MKDEFTVDLTSDSGGYKIFKSKDEGWVGCGYKWKETELKVRRVIQEDRNEVQISFITYEVKHSGRAFKKYESITIPKEHIESLLAAITNDFKG